MHARYPLEQSVVIELLCGVLHIDCEPAACPEDTPLSLHPLRFGV
jgi:hypothetical protein